MQKHIFMLVFAIGLMVPFSAAYALPFIDVNPDIFKKPLIPGDILSNLAKERCEKLTEKLQERKERFAKRQENHEAAYQKLTTRLETLLAKLEARGYDVSDLEAELATLKAKIKEFSQDADAVIAKLAEIYGMACDATDAEVKAELSEARVLVKEVRSDVKDIRTYYTTVIKPDIKALKK